MFTRLQPIVYVRDLEAESAFYTALGFNVSRHSADFAEVTGAECILFGLQRQSNFDPHTAASRMIWQIGVRSVKAIHQMGLQRALTVKQGPSEMDWAEWTTVFESPNGYPVIFEGPA